MQFIIDGMRLTDWTQVRIIYEAGVVTGQATFETEIPEWEQWDSDHIQQCRLVARANDQVLGWAALSPVSRRKVYSGVAEVSIYIADDVRGQGVGNRLMAALVEESERQGFWTLQSSIFPENRASVSLHLKHGFREMGRRERIAKRDDIWRDTILFERRSAVVGLD